MASDKTIRSFNASFEVNNLINESGIKKGEMSNWINDKIKKGFLYDKNPNIIETVITQGRNLRIKI